MTEKEEKRKGEFVILPCTEKDIPGILKIVEEAENTLEHREWYVTDGEDFFAAHMEREGFVLKAEERQTGRMAGFLAVRIPGESRDNLGRFWGLTEADLLRTAHMESAAVAPAFRGHGLQGRMMAEAERMLRERGFSWLMGTVHPENIYSRNHFLKLGYEAAVRTEMYGGLPREIMVKKL